MKRLTVHLAIALLTFTVGVTSGAFWYAHKQAEKLRTGGQQTEPGEQERALTPVTVLRALQTRTISTRNVRRNSDDEIVWRWLKQSIAEYPQKYVNLNITETSHYSIIINKPDTLDESQLMRINAQLKGLGRPPLQAGKRYAEVIVTQDGVICPDWYGLIDVDAAKLTYFEGRSG